MAWIYSQVSAGLASHSALGCEQSRTVSGMSTPKRCSCPEWPTRSSTLHRSGTMCAACLGACFPSWTSSPEASLARISALQEMERVWQAADQGYFSKSSDSLANFDPDSFSWKTSQLSLFGGLTEFSWSSLRWGTIVDGRLYQPQRWEPRILERDGFVLPTPTATPYGSNQSQSDGAAVRISLDKMARTGRFPTPRASDGDKSGNDPETLVGHVRATWPTPAARDWKDGLTPKPHGAHSPSVTVAVAVAVAGHQGFLNPAFVEVMMGYSEGWTVLGAVEMQWFQFKRGKRSSVSQASNEIVVPGQQSVNKGA